MKVKIRIWRTVLVVLVLAAALSAAGCTGLKAWNADVLCWWESSDPFIGSDGEYHYPAPGHVWRYVTVWLRNNTLRPQALQLDDFALVTYDDSYQPSAWLPTAQALPLSYTPHAEGSGILVFDAAFPRPDSCGGTLLAALPGDPAMWIVLLDSLQQ